MFSIGFWVDGGLLQQPSHLTHKGGNHTCETILTMVNTVYEEHGTLPKRFTAQGDNAATNKTWVVLGVLGVYCVEGVFQETRLRCCMEDHAHDVYDAFHGIHVTRLSQETYFTIDEVEHIIKDAHRQAYDRHAAEGGENKPIMGHDVLISCLWEIRDFWEWLVPGHNVDKGAGSSFTTAAFVSYRNLHKYRDFLLKEEDRSTPENRVIGLWAKHFMTDASYTYIGTFMTRELLDGVIANRELGIAKRSSREQRRAREKAVSKSLRAVTRGPYQEQFPEARLADALAVVEHRWDHFAGKAMPARRRELPAQLAARMRADGVLPMPGESSESSLASVESEEARLVECYPRLGDPPPPPPMHQREHSLAEAAGIHRGEGIQVVPPSGSSAPKTVAEFNLRPRLPGFFVLTLAAHSSHLAKQYKPLKAVPFWVWKVLRVVNVGEPLSANNRHLSVATEQTWEAQLFGPVDKHAADMSHKLGPCFDKLDKKLFLRSPQERKERDEGGDAWSDGIHKPLTAFLRAANISGGGFSLTPTGKLPGFIQQYAKAHLVSVESGVSSGPASSSAEQAIEAEPLQPSAAELLKRIRRL